MKKINPLYMAFSVSTHNGHSFGVMNMDIGKQMAKIQLWLKSISH